jgi:hypothetical protein
MNTMTENILKCEVIPNTNKVKIFQVKPKKEPEPEIVTKRALPEDSRKLSGRWKKEEHLVFIKGNLPNSTIYDKAYRNMEETGIQYKMKFQADQLFNYELMLKSFS